MDLLCVEHVTKRYATHTALHDVSLAIPRGAVYGLLGPNGAGKTTLIRIINRITAPDEGRVLLGGRCLAPEDVRRIGYLPEERGLYKKMKVGEQALYFAQLKGLSKREATLRLKRWFEKFGIAGWWDKKVEELSKGMAQKVQFIVTVLHEPELLIFDEPFSGFDPVNAERLKQEILELKEKGHTIIFSTHNMASVEEICDNIALINKSQVVLSGNVAEVRNRFRNNTFTLRISSDSVLSNTPADTFTLLSEKEQSGIRELQIHKADGISNSTLLSTLSEQVEILSFAEELPSMNDIFINTVSGTNTTQA